MLRTEIIERAIPEGARKRCADPVSLPDRDLTQREVAALWGRDRVSLRECEIRRAAAVSGGADE